MKTKCNGDKMQTVQRHTVKGSVLPTPSFLWQGSFLCSLPHNLLLQTRLLVRLRWTFHQTSADGCLSTARGCDQVGGSCQESWAGQGPWAFNVSLKLPRTGPLDRFWAPFLPSGISASDRALPPQVFPRIPSRPSADAEKKVCDTTTPDHV